MSLKPALQPLPVLALVLTAYRYVWAERLTFLRLATPWLGAGLAIAAGAAPLGLYSQTTAGLLVSLIDWLGYAAVAVAWLRHLVLGEAWPGLGAPLRAPAVRYLLWSAALGMAALLPVLAASLLAALVPALRVPLLAAGTFVAVVIAVHLLFLPLGAALDERLAVAQSIQLVRGHAIRIVFGFVAAIVPLALASVVAAIIVSELTDAQRLNAGGLLLRDLVVRLLHYADASITASFLAGLYSRLVRGVASAGGT